MKRSVKKFLTRLANIAILLVLPLEVIGGFVWALLVGEEQVRLREARLNARLQQAEKNRSRLGEK